MYVMKTPTTRVARRFGSMRTAVLVVALLCVALATTRCSSPTPTVLEEPSVVTADPVLDAPATVALTSTPDANYPPPVPSGTPRPEGYIAPVE